MTMTRNAGDARPEYRVRAYNYAERSSNKMHSHDVAARYGYRGGLVPGVAIYAYMCEPIAAALGEPWLAGGTMSGKFIHPVYDGEEVRVSARATEADLTTLTIEVHNAEDALCAVGEASLPAEIDSPDPADWPERPLPERKYPASIAALPEGLELGSLDIPFEGRNTRGEFDRFLDEVRSAQPMFERDEYMHPAFLAAKANRLLMENVDLGPWIHTATTAQHLGVPSPGDRLSFRARILERFERRGHEIVTLDVAVFANASAPCARLRHSAIIRPYEQRA
jgi:acyl dehydratase